MTRTIGRLAQLADRLLRRRQIGSIGETDQRHFGRGQRARRILHILHALEQDLPGPRQDADRQLVGEFLGALALDLAHRGILGRRGRDLGARDEMAELGQIDQDVGGVGARLVQGAHDLKGLGDLDPS